MKYDKYISLTKPYKMEVEIQEWWTEVCSIGGDRWTTLEHNGPYFGHISDPYVPMNVNLIYDGKEYSLNSKEEEVDKTSKVKRKSRKVKKISKKRSK